MMAVLEVLRKVRPTIGLLVLGGHLLALPQGFAAEIPVEEARAYEAARRALDDGLYEFAERNYSEFITRFPESSLIAEVRLQLSKARYHLRKYDQALTFLRRFQDEAGVLGDQYQYWIAETLLAQGDAGAADAFGVLPERFPNSSLKLDAAFRQALVRFEEGDYNRAARLLSDPDGVFEQARQSQPSAVAAVAGLLVLADAQLALDRNPGVLQTLEKLPGDSLTREQVWRRLNLRSQALVALDQPAEAEMEIDQLMELAREIGRPELIAESNAQRAMLMEQLGRPDEALKAYQPNLEPSVAPGWRRQALVKTVELSLATGSSDEVIQKLELLSAAQLDAPAKDLVQLTLGELRLKQFYELADDPRAGAATLSNVLAKADAHFNLIVTGFTNSPYLGKAWMNGAWCDWEWKRWAESESEFGRASRLLSPGVDQAISIFKQGDAQFMQERYEGALTNYHRLLTEYAEHEVIKEQLLDQVFYQIIQAAIAADDLEAAVSAMQGLIRHFPGSFYADKSLLLVGQALNDIRDPAGARKVFEGFEERFAGSSLEPEVELAVIRTYELEGNWAQAVEQYREWLARHEGHASVPAASFGLAWAEFQAGDVNQAMSGFTNFVQRFPTNNLAPTALIWLGDEFYSRQDYSNAELHYQMVFVSSNWPSSTLTYNAQIMAGRAAFARTDYSEAKRYLTNVINNPKCPDEVFTAGLFALGDVLMSEPAEKSAKFLTARSAFDKIVASQPESAEVPAALGRIGDCNFQLGLYVDATNAYQRCMSHPRASVSERSQAEVKLGETLKQMAELEGADRGALREQAMERYLNVFYQLNITPEQGQIADSYWVQRAGMEAAALANIQGRHRQAADIYRTLQEMLPQMKAQLERRIQQQEELSRRGEG